MKIFLTSLAFVALASASHAETAGRLLYMQNCVPCHGVGGKGDGPAAAGLETPPADLTRIAARRDGVWPMLEVMGILDGYFKQTIPREGMPVFEEFLDDEMSEFDTGNGVPILVPTKLIEIVYYLEALQDPAPTSYVP